MGLNINNDAALKLAQELAVETGESLTEAVIIALRERLTAVRLSRHPGVMKEEVKRIQDFVAALPDASARSPEELLDYDEFGLPR